MSPGASSPQPRAAKAATSNDAGVRSNGFSRSEAAEAATTNEAGARSNGFSRIPNLVITGFMGTGKTAVGRRVADLLARPFVDMDAEIEARAGKPVPRIFADEGEPAFRRLESVLCRELAARQGLVIATGGGALVDAENRAVMMAAGTVVCLTATEDEIVHRVRAAGPSGRPLLDVADPAAEVRRLLAARRGAYAAIPWHVETTGRAIEEIAAEVATLARGTTLRVRHPTGSYPVHVGPGLLARLGQALRAVTGGTAEGSRVAVVSNPIVEPLYGLQARASLAAAGFRPVACTLPDGEQQKTLATVAALYEQLLDGGLDRGDTVLSLGGGVTGAEAGFAAATYLRGVRFVQVPTTLLAMVDAGVGAKTGVDLPRGKNLVGAFKQPALVLADPEVLATLPPAEVRAGMAEVLKHAIIGDADLFARLERPPADPGRPLSAPQLARAIAVKVAVVEADPYEAGQRAVLNLGHTVGHALERLSGYGLRHGEAVAIGTVAAARLAAALGRTDGDGPALIGRIEAALAAWGLPLRCPPSPAGPTKSAGGTPNAGSCPGPLAGSRSSTA
ncbi:MAG: bifunctional shikimate kinase/3-dehydroquinate synthase [Anaerolineae bacterium]